MKNHKQASLALNACHLVLSLFLLANSTQSIAAETQPKPTEPSYRYRGDIGDEEENRSPPQNDGIPEAGTPKRKGTKAPAPSALPGVCNDFPTLPVCQKH